MKKDDAEYYGLWIGGVIITIVGFASGCTPIGVTALIMLLIIVGGDLLIRYSDKE